MSHEIKIELLKDHLKLLVPFSFLQGENVFLSQTLKREIRFVAPGRAQRVQDIDCLENAKNALALFWIEDGAWQNDNKTNVDRTWKVFTERGRALVSANDRLLPEVDMQTLAKDKAIPPSLTQHVTNHPDTPLQIQRLKEVEESGNFFGGKEKLHARIIADLGTAGSVATIALNEFMDQMPTTSLSEHYHQP